MPRLRRLYLPRAGFHITARTQNGAQYFNPEMRFGIAEDIEQSMTTFGHTLLAYVVMPNHFHIVIKQGEAPLGWVMQRIMQRTVVRVRREHGGEGHVFGRPFWSCVCATPGYLRRAIVYTHMNPCKAGLSENPQDYIWSSQRHFTADSTPSDPRKYSALEGLMLFADTSVDHGDVVRNYIRFIDHCIVQRANGVPGDYLLPDGPHRHLLPNAAHGDTHWASHYSTFSEAKSFTRANLDVAHPATSILKRIDPQLDLHDLRGAGRSFTLGKVRRMVIEGLLVHGCRNTAISRCLQVSPSLVSSISAQMRVSATPAH